jgi:acetyl esterase
MTQGKPMATDTIRLWDDEVDAARAEARDMIAVVMPTVTEMMGGATPGYDVDATTRAEAIRAAFSGLNQNDPAATDRLVDGIRCRVHQPQGPSRAVYLHFHGGGMVIGSPEMSDDANRALADAQQVTVVSVDYRLAPEHPFPAGPDDGIAVVRWLLAEGLDQFGVDRFILGGESAGGYMAAAVLLRVRDELDAIDRVSGANLVYGVFDWGIGPSQRGIRPGAGEDILNPDEVRWFGDCYLPGLSREERRDPYRSPLFADLSGLVPALMSVGTSDHLLDDTLMLANRWAVAGNEVELFVAPDMPHGFQAFPCTMTKIWARRTAAWFDRLLTP